jgi:hypothetical protein
MDDSELIDDLSRQFENGQILVVVGAGVSIGATGGHPVASWDGLLGNGIERCVRLGLVPDGWEETAREELQSKDLEKWLSVAEKVTGRSAAHVAANMDAG